MIHEGTRTGSLPNCGHFTRELAVSRRTHMRDLDFLRDDPESQQAGSEAALSLKPLMHTGCTQDAHGSAQPAVPCSQKGGEAGTQGGKAAKAPSGAFGVASAGSGGRG